MCRSEVGPAAALRRIPQFWMPGKPLLNCLRCRCRKCPGLISAWGVNVVVEAKRLLSSVPIPECRVIVEDPSASCTLASQFFDLRACNLQSDVSIGLRRCGGGIDFNHAVTSWNPVRLDNQVHRRSVCVDDVDAEVLGGEVRRDWEREIVAVQNIRPPVQRAPIGVFQRPHPPLYGFCGSITGANAASPGRRRVVAHPFLSPIMAGG